MTYFTYGTPHIRGRSNVREPVTSRITVPLLDLTGAGREDASMQLTVTQALELSQLLVAQAIQFCRRSDIARALYRTDPLP